MVLINLVWYVQMTLVVVVAVILARAVLIQSLLAPMEHHWIRALVSMFPKKRVKTLMAHIFLDQIAQTLFALVHVAFLRVGAKTFPYELAKINSLVRFKGRAQRARQSRARQEVAVVWMLMEMVFKMSALILQTKSVLH
jgi:hypothetical protein